MTVDFAERGLPTKLPVEIGSCLYKVIQEGLRNAVKHAQTRRARVALACKGSVLRLSVSRMLELGSRHHRLSAWLA